MNIQESSTHMASECGLSTWLAWATSQHGGLRVVKFLQGSWFPLNKSRSRQTPERPEPESDSGASAAICWPKRIVRGGGNELYLWTGGVDLRLPPFGSKTGARGRHDQWGPALTLAAMQWGDGSTPRGRRLRSSSTEAGPDAPGLPDWPGPAGEEERRLAPQTGSVPMVATMIRRERAPLFH